MSAVIRVIHDIQRELTSNALCRSLPHSHSLRAASVPPTVRQVLLPPAPLSYSQKQNQAALCSPSSFFECHAHTHVAVRANAHAHAYVRVRVGARTSPLTLVHQCASMTGRRRTSPLTLVHALASMTHTCVRACMCWCTHWLP